MKTKLFTRVMPVAMAVTLIGTSIPMVALADSSKVVTLGADLTDEQKSQMYEYFGTSGDQVTTIEVTNADERQYLEGVATEDQIGTRTLSCAYVEPTSEGGIQVKVANLTFVTSSMIASTLLTSGVENCNVVAACPMEVSGTGALTGIMMAYEQASGDTLNEEQKQTATDELVTTGDLAEDVGDTEATEIMNDVKEEVISGDATDEDSIKSAIEDAASDAGVELTDDQISSITNIMLNIANYNYNVDAFNETLNNLSGGGSSSGGYDNGFIAGVLETINNLAGGSSSGSSSDAGIINDTDDSLLGDDATINSTIDGIVEDATDAASGDSDSDGSNFFDKIMNFVNDIVGKITGTDVSESADPDSTDSSTVDASWDFDGDESDASVTEESSDADSSVQDDTDAEEDSSTDEEEAEADDSDSTDDADATDAEE